MIRTALQHSSISYATTPEKDGSFYSLLNIFLRKTRLTPWPTPFRCIIQAIKKSRDGINQYRRQSSALPSEYKHILVQKRCPSQGRGYTTPRATEHFWDERACPLCCRNRKFGLRSTLQRRIMGFPTSTGLLALGLLAANFGRGVRGQDENLPTVVDEEMWVPLIDRSWPHDAQPTWCRGSSFLWFPLLLLLLRRRRRRLRLYINDWRLIAEDVKNINGIILRSSYYCSTVGTLLNTTGIIKYAGWLKLNDGNLFPGQSPRRFLESNRDFFAHVFYEPSRRPGCPFFVLHDFWPIKIFLGNLDLLRPNAFSNNKKKGTEVGPSWDGHIENTCANFQGIIS